MAVIFYSNNLLEFKKCYFTYLFIDFTLFSLNALFVSVIFNAWNIQTNQSKFVYGSIEITNVNVSDINRSYQHKWKRKFLP